MNTRELICTVCPNGCRLTVAVNPDGTAASVTGARCKRGETFGRQEVVCPQRVLTSTVVVDGKQGEELLPVRSSDAFALNLHLQVMALLHHVRVSAPVKMGDVILKNVLDSGVDIIASCDMD